MQSITQRIAAELGVREAQIQAAVALLDGGATVPFVARYRKEATGGLDDIALRALDTRLVYLRELEQRRLAVIEAIEHQGQLSLALRQALVDAATKQDLEDLYLPFRRKRRTKGELAREAGLEPLADLLLADPCRVPIDEAQAFLVAPASPSAAADKRPDFSTAHAVLDGVRDILSERWAEQSVLVQGLRDWLWASGQLKSRLRTGKDGNQPDVAKFRDYFDYAEPIRQVPSHRALAVFRGRARARRHHQECLRLLDRDAAGVRKQPVGQWFQPRLAGQFPFCAPLLPERKVQVLQLLLGGGILQGLAQCGRQLALLFDRLDHGQAPLLQFAQVDKPRVQRAQRDVVQAIGGLLAVTRDKWHGRTAVEQSDCSLDLGFAYAQFCRDALRDGLHILVWIR